jgi:hypothetical protein
VLEISLKYWGIMTEKYHTTQKSTGKAKFTSAEGYTTDKEQVYPTGSPSLMKCCPSLELDRLWVHSLCGCLIGKRTSGGGFRNKEV